MNKSEIDQQTEDPSKDTGSLSKETEVYKKQNGNFRNK